MPASPNDQTPRPTSAFIAISRCPAGSEGKPFQDQRKEKGNAEAYPLARGEHSDRTTQNDLQQGSSPLARGTPELRGSNRGVVRLIPAHAGNTCGDDSGRRRPRAHPRSRGEHADFSTFGRGLSGSSPLARGTQCTNSPAFGKIGLIPARAGNTTVTRVPVTRSGAHPR